MDPGAQGNKVWLMPGYENSNGILNVADNHVCVASRTCEGSDENSGERLSGHITFAASILVSGVISTSGHLADTGAGVIRGSQPILDHN